jgi:hypothetical protein
MGNQVIPFENAQLPAWAQQFNAAEADDLISGAGGGFPSISIKGKVFTLVRGDERTIIPGPGGDGAPAQALDLVILRANRNFSKNFYKGSYVEGSDDKPTCYSDDGIAPAADAQEPQATKCMTCPQNQWGAKITEDGKKVKACADSRKLAVAAAGAVGDAMLIRVPAASLKPLAEYGKLLKARGVSYQHVVTRISFDFAAAFPSLTFKPTGFIQDEAVFRKIMEMKESDLVQQILGLTSRPALPAPASVEQAPVQREAPPPVQAAPAPAPAPKATKAATKPAAPLAAAVEPAPVQAAQPVVVSGGASDAFSAQLTAVLSAAGFPNKAGFDDDTQQ